MTEQEALNLLRTSGYTFTPSKLLRTPTPDHDITAAEMAAATCLLIDHDYPGFEPEQMKQGAAAFRAGRSLKDNPYDCGHDGSRSRPMWQAGWEEAADAWLAL